MSGFFGSFAHGFSMFFHVTVVATSSKITCDSQRRFADGHERLQDPSDLRWVTAGFRESLPGRFRKSRLVHFAQICPSLSKFCPFFQLPTTSPVAALTLLNLFRGQDLSVLVEEAVAAIAVCFVTDLVLVDLLLVKFDGRADFFSLFPHH